MNKLIFSILYTIGTITMYRSSLTPISIAISPLNCNYFCYLNLKEGEIAIKYDTNFIFDINSRGELIAIFPNSYDFNIDTDGNLIAILNK